MHRARVRSHERLLASLEGPGDFALSRRVRRDTLEAEGVRVNHPKPATSWYFAYGSNLDPRTFLGRRNMRPLATRVAHLADFELRFDLPVGRAERGVANVSPRRGAGVWGVAYQLTARDLMRLDRSEGVHRGFYQRIAVRVTCDDGPARAAWTYQSLRGRPGRKPSRRYLGLLLRGARHHGLPAGYVTALRSLELAQDERNPQIALPFLGAGPA